MITDTSEKALETLIVEDMTGRLLPAPPGAVPETCPLWGGTGWLRGDSGDYDRVYAVDLAQLQAFIAATQPRLVEALDLDHDGPTRRKFLARLQGEVTKRGVIDILRHGLKHGQHSIDVFYGTPSAGNAAAATRYGTNRFSVTRQLRYSLDETQRALDLCLFINGLPVATFELKNSLTKQTVADAVLQYQRDRKPAELLFTFGRCVAHFAVDDAQVRFCTQLSGETSWFLPFDQGYNDGAGNPPNADGLKTAYLWQRMLTPAGLTDILENYAQIVEEKDARTRKVKRKQIFPRYHQLDVVRQLLAHATQHGAGRRYLIEHSAGSGKSNSIAWLAHQLVSLAGGGALVFDSIVVVTDRVILDKQIENTVKQFAQVSSTIAHAEHSGDLRSAIQAGKKIIITTVQKFPFILKDIAEEHEHRSRRFAIIIDEAHSSQGGRAAGAVSTALSPAGAAVEDETTEDTINRIMETHKLLPNASYFAFTATPKNKTLELFGDAYEEDGVTKHRPFHSYTMKQAIEEGFILDVLASYTPVYSYYKLVKTIPGDPQFDVKRARKKLRRYVESHDYAVRLKAEIMVDHFLEQVVALGKIGGQARAMVVSSGIERAIQYYFAISTYLTELKSPYKAIVAFSGEYDFRGDKLTEAKVNGFPSSEIADRIQEDPYRFLVCADKFQTGYDEPLLHTMYVDKVLSGVKAVQTLSRLNRAHPQKHDVFVLDFVNDAETIRLAFEPYYRTTLLSQETDPNKLHDLKADFDGYQVYAGEQIQQLVTLYLGGAGRDRLDPILDACVPRYLGLDEPGQVAFKARGKVFVRAYSFLSAILPYSDAGWEKLSIFLNFLLPKLPAPVEQDLSRGILETIDMDSYRVEKKAVIKIQLADSDQQIDPATAGAAAAVVEPEMDRLSAIIRSFNELYGGIAWTDKDRVHRLITKDIPDRVAADPYYTIAKNNPDRENARIEHDAALKRVMAAILKDDTQLFKEYSNNESFRRWLGDKVFEITYQ